MTPTDAAVRYFLDVDRRDWAALRAAMTDKVDVDYTSLSGGDPEQLAAEDLLDRWRALLPGFDATQHFLGPMSVTIAPDETAVLDCNVRAYHRLTGQAGHGELWMVAGAYTLTLRAAEDTWLIAGITLRVTYQEGDPTLVQVATERAAAR